MKEMREFIDNQSTLQQNDHQNKQSDVGFINADNKIHLGRGIWRPKTAYENVVNSCATTNKFGKFVKQMAICVFGISVLTESSVGRLTKENTVQTHDSNNRPALDPIKVLAIKDIFGYFLQHEKHLDDVRVDEELSKMKNYLSQKVYELRNSPKKGPKKGSKTEFVKTAMQNKSENVCRLPKAPWTKIARAL